MTRQTNEWEFQGEALSWFDEAQRSESACWHPLLNGSPKCYYHSKLAAGFLSDSYGRYHATPPDRPELERGEDGWITITDGGGALMQVLAREPWSA